MRLAALCCLGACSFAHGIASPGSDATATADATEDTHAIDGAVDSAVDGAVDAPPDAALTWTTVETLSVPCVTQAVVSTTVLLSTRMYRLRASGECISNTTNGSKADAEYFGYNVGPTYDTYNNVDNGIAIDDLTPGTSKQPAWGTYAATHTYEVAWTGANATITAAYHDSNDTNNSGMLTLAILAYQ